MTNEQKRQAKILAENGFSVDYISFRVGCSRRTAKKYFDAVDDNSHNQHKEG